MSIIKDLLSDGKKLESDKNNFLLLSAIDFIESMERFNPHYSKCKLAGHNSI